ncbi:polyketide synthase [Streptomyces nogalater]
MIRGSALNNDGATETLPTPGRASQERVLLAACADAGVEPGEVRYVELHGSGTRVGDPIEAAALGATLGSARTDDAPLLVGSVKTNIGHLEGAAGIAGFIKAVLCVSERELVPSLNHSGPGDRIPLDALRLRVNTEIRPWPAPTEPLLAGVSSFGIGGTNCHVIVADWQGAEPAGGEAGTGALPRPGPDPATTRGTLDPDRPRRHRGAGMGPVGTRRGRAA